MRAMKMFTHAAQVLKGYGVSLDVFYSISINPTYRVTLQGRIDVPVIKKLHEAFKLELGSDGYVRGKYDTQVEVNDEPLAEGETLKDEDVLKFYIEIVLTD